MLILQVEHVACFSLARIHWKKLLCLWLVLVLQLFLIQFASNYLCGQLIASLLSSTTCHSSSEPLLIWNRGCKGNSYLRKLSMCVQSPHHRQHITISVHSAVQSKTWDKELSLMNGKGKHQGGRYWGIDTRGKSAVDRSVDRLHSRCQMPPKKDAL